MFHEKPGTHDQVVSLLKIPLSSIVLVLTPQFFVERLPLLVRVAREREIIADVFPPALEAVLHSTCVDLLLELF